MTGIRFPVTGGLRSDSNSVTLPPVAYTATSLAAAYVAGTRTVSLTRGVQPGTGLSGQFFIAVDVGSVNCEIGDVTVSGTTATIGTAWALNHALGAPVVLFADMDVPVNWFGAVGDGSTDDTAAWQQALLQSSVGHRPLWITGGMRQYILSYPLLWPDGARVRRVGGGIGFGAAPGFAPVADNVAMHMSLGSSSNVPSGIVPYSFSGGFVSAPGSAPVAGTGILLRGQMPTGSGGTLPVNNGHYYATLVSGSTFKLASLPLIASAANLSVTGTMNATANVTSIAGSQAGVIVGQPVSGTNIPANTIILEGPGVATTTSGGGQVITTTPSTLNVASVAGFPAAGTCTVAGVTGTVTYTSITASPASLNGCTIASGSFTATNNGAVTGTTWRLSRAATGSGTGVTVSTSSSDIDTTDISGATGLCASLILATTKLFVDDVFVNCRNTPGVNGAAFHLQQPADFRRLRIDNQAPIAWATLSSTLSTSGLVSALPVNAVAQAIPPGLVRLVAPGGQWQMFQTVGYTPAGATSINVVAQKMNFAFVGGAPVTVTGDTVTSGTTISNVTGSQTGVQNGCVLTGANLNAGTTLVSGAGTSTWVVSRKPVVTQVGATLSAAVGAAVTNSGFGLWLNGQQALFLNYESIACETAISLDDAEFMDFIGRCDIESFTFRGIHVRPQTVVMANNALGGALNCTFNPMHMELSPGVQAVFDLEGQTECLVIGTGQLSWTPSLPTVLPVPPAYVWCHAGTTVNSGYQLLGQQPRVNSNVSQAGYLLVNDTDRNITIDMFTDLNTRGISGFDAGRVPSGSVGQLDNVRQVYAGPLGRILKVFNLNRAKANIDSTPASDQTGPSVVFRDTAGLAAWQILPDGRVQYAKAANEATGAGSASLGANSPAVTNTAPYTWEKVMSSDGSTVFFPVWK